VPAIPGAADQRRPQPPSADGLDPFAADGEIGRDLAAVDWAATPLGPVQGWPQSLRTAISILLSSRFSMWMAWGPQHTFFCNAAYRRDTLGRKYPWALGRPAKEVWAEVWAEIAPRLDTVLTTAESTWDEALLLFLERSGYPEETYHTFSYSPLRDDGGAVVGMLCVVSEDTDRIIGERRMATLRDLGSDPSVVRAEQESLDFAGRQVGRNLRDLPFTLTYLFEEGGDARLAQATGITAGHPAAPPTIAADEAGAVWPAQTVLRGEPSLVELGGEALGDLPTGDWSRPPAQALVLPLLRQGGSPYGFLVAALNRYRPLDEGYRGFVELTAGHIAAGIAIARSYAMQQRRAEELAELDRAKTAFFSNISHEFRTPLTLIMGPLEELRGRLAEADAGARAELETMHRNGTRLGKLVNALLDFARIEAGRMRARYEPVDLAGATAEFASVFRSAVERAGLRFEVDCRALPEPVYVDRDMWEKIVLNLLSNALKFTFEGSIGVAVRAERGRAVVTVADTGIGVPQSEAPLLFERFHRIENARSRSNEGSGIGLALVKELVELHGGTIAADSREGVGTTFTVRMPLGAAHLPQDALIVEAGAAVISSAAEPFIEEASRWLPPNPSDEDAVAGGAGIEPTSSSRTLPARILVADDNADMRAYLTRLLRGAGHEVVVCTDGQYALEAARAQAPDLIVSDVMMPRLNGLDLVLALREDPRTSSIPVLLLSARAGQEDSIEGLEAGADDYLVKPFAAAELLARVRANVELARLRTHHMRWRTALVDSLQEAFFVCDENGAVVEINAAFEDILGYGPEGLPYPAPQPWWPDEEGDRAAHARVVESFANLLERHRGMFTVPLIHREGHRVWVSAAFNQVQDPETGRRVIVGTCRDVTDEHYAIQRESALAALSLRLSRATSRDEALGGALDELRSLWGARLALAAVFTGAGSRPEVTATDPAADWDSLPSCQQATLTKLREGPFLTPAIDPESRNGVGIGLEHPQGPMALWLDIGSRRRFTDQDLTLLSLLAGHLAHGLARAHQIDRERETALALQRAILGPSRLPAGFAVRYEPAARPLEVGGDWYDTVELPGNRIGIVVGDCVGRGLEAATVMGQLRSACRALLLQDPRPDQVLVALDHFADGIPGAMCTTVFCGVLDTVAGKISYSSAGHLPGILAFPDGTTQLLDGALALPLAVRPGAPRPCAEREVPTRSALLLYTDGLVERRRVPLTDGIARAARVMREERGVPLEELAAHLMARLAPADGYEDDVALLLYRQPAPLVITFPAEADQLAPVRGALRGWLELCELPLEQVQKVLVAAGEACTNAIEHGRRRAQDTVRLRAEALADHINVVVADTGAWKVPVPIAGSRRGHGLVVMRAMMDDVAITSDDAGTTVEMRTRIQG
jgi:PAS domain S-box-containing protein